MREQPKLLDGIVVPINRAGWPFIGLAFVVAVTLGFVAPPLFWLGLLAVAFCTYFFRDPPRVTPDRDGLIVSPADGRLQMIETATPPPGDPYGTRSAARIYSLDALDSAFRIPRSALEWHPWPDLHRLGPA